MRKVETSLCRMQGKYSPLKLLSKLLGQLGIRGSGSLAFQRVPTITGQMSVL